MWDCHYDLLTYLYMHRDNVPMIKEFCKKIYRRDNITGGIFNLFYMSEKEMWDELKIAKEEINVIENLREVRDIIEKEQVIPEDISYLFGIEGLDYLEKIEDVDSLYELGLRSTNIVWNNANKFGGGARAERDCGLTDLGRELVKKLVEKRIAIDLSHANEKTFWDVIEVCRKERKEEPIVFASHSNVKKICPVKRNLTDEQIRAVAEMGGVIGVVSIKNFCIDNKDVKDKTIDFRKAYIQQINYIKDLLGTTENIAVATDNMGYYEIDKEYYSNANVYPQEVVAEEIREDLEKEDYTKQEVEGILYENFEKRIKVELCKWNKMGKSLQSCEKCGIIESIS